MADKPQEPDETEEETVILLVEPKIEPVHVFEDGFGFFFDPKTNKNEIIRRYTMTNQNNFTLQVISYGATITSIKYPDKDGVLDDIVLGYDNFYHYLNANNPYFGATIGRVANRMKRGIFTLGGKDYFLEQNLEGNHFHGGLRGFDKVPWKSMIKRNKVYMSYCSGDGEEGYPGGLLVTAIFSLNAENEVTIEMLATASKPTPIALTNRSYFNLAGHGTGHKGLYQHTVQFNADQFAVTGMDYLTTGDYRNVHGTLWELRQPTLLGDIIRYIPFGGYDQNMCVSRTSSEDMTFVARIIHYPSGRLLEVYSNQKGVQFCTANDLPRDPYLEINEGDPILDDIKGKHGCHYYKHQGFCVQTQTYPDSVNFRHFPNVILKPNEQYRHVVTYKFSLYEEVDLDPQPTPEPEILYCEGEGEEC